jgi:MFS family permease
MPKQLMTGRLWRLRSLKEMFIVGGILLGYLTSYLFVDNVGGWRLMYGLAAGPAVILLAGMVRHDPSTSAIATVRQDTVSMQRCQ